MIATWLLSFFSIENAKPIIISIVVAVALAALGWFAYDSGYDKADALGKATLATVQRKYSDASANATAEAYQKLERETKRADNIAGELIMERNRIAKFKKELIGRIPYVVAHTAPCTFGAEFVELRNRAYGLYSSALPKNACTAGTEARPGEAGAVSGGVCNATVEDLLTWDADMGEYVGNLEKQRDGLKALVMGAE